MTLLLHQSVQQEILETNAFNSSNVPYYVSLMKGNAWLQTADHQFISGLLIKVSGLLNAKSDANRWAASQLMILLIQEVPEKIVDKIAAWMNGLLGNLKVPFH